VNTEAVAISQIAKRNKLNASTFKKQYKDHLSNFREWELGLIPDMLVYPENFGPRMSIDETSLQNGELYTVLTNKDKKGKKGALAALIKGTKASVVSKAICTVSIKKRMEVREITLDLAKSMDWICRECFPNAIKTADRFHFQKVVSEGVQEIRIKLRRKVIDEYNAKVMEAKKRGERYESPTYANGDTKKQLLARGRYLLFKPKSKWTASQTERAEILFDKFPELKTAYMASLMFRNIFEVAKSREDGKKRLYRWYEKISISNLPEMISAGNTIKNNEGKILNYFYTRSTNASAESFNAKLKGFRSLLRGVGDIKFFLFRIEKLFA
jgi:transposase